MPTPDTARVETALASVAEVQAQLGQTQVRLRAETQVLQDHLTILGLELLDNGEVVDRELIRRLYWDAPSLPVRAVYQAFGLRSPNDVSIIAGHREFSLPCQDCATALTHMVANRTQLAKLRSANLCGPCAETADERQRQRHAELEAEHRRRRREENETLQHAMQAYVLSHPELPEEPHGAAMYVEISVPEWGCSTVRLAELNDIRRDLAERLSP